MAFLKTALNVSCVLASLCSVIFSQAPAPGTDPALFSNLFMSSPQPGGSSSNMINPSAGAATPDLTSLVSPSGSSFASPGASGSLPMFPTLGSSLGGMPQAASSAPRPNPMSGLMRMMLFRKMDMGNMWPLLAFGLGGSNGGGGMGGLFSNPLMMYSMFQNM